MLSCCDVSYSKKKMTFSFGNFLGHWQVKPVWFRHLSWILALSCVVSGITTYVVFEYLPLFLLLDSAFLLLLSFLVLRRILLLWHERRRGLAGSKLHVQVVSVFSLLVIAPAMVMALFSGFFLHLGMQAWFNEKVQTAIQESQAVANAYLEEHQKVIAHSVRAMKHDLEEVLEQFSVKQIDLDAYLTTQAHFRSLTEAIVFSQSGRVLGRSQFSFSLEFEEILGSDLQKARHEVVIYSNQRHDRVIALVQILPDKDLYLLVSRLVDKKVLQRMASTQEAVGAYQRLLQERSSFAVQFAIIFLVITLLMLLLAIWGGFIFANQLVKPIGQLIQAAGRVREGDLSVRVETTTVVNELGTLGAAFNQMVTELDEQTRTLLTVNQELEQRRQFTENVLAGVSAGVMGLDQEGRVHLPNAMALRLLDLQEADCIGKTLHDIAPELAVLFEQAQYASQPFFEQQIMLERQGQMHILNVHFTGNSQKTYATKEIVLTFDNVTELVSAQRKAAWSDVARRIAHEIKNPLTPIQLAAERLKRRYLKQIQDDPETFQICIETIVRQVEHIGQMISEFSSFARMPSPVMMDQNLATLCKQALFLQQEVYPDIVFTLNGPSPEPSLICDPQQMSQVLTNLLKNAAESIQERCKAEPSLSGEITLHLFQDKKGTTLEVWDNGIGFPKEGREHLTEPYVTTKIKGTGLGLAIVRKIIEDHQGTLFLRNREDSLGGKVVLAFKGDTHN